MPFTIVALAPFTSLDNTAWRDDPVVIDSDTFDTVVDTLKPKFFIPVPREICPEGRLDITCSRMKDFHPDGLVRNNTYLKNLCEAKGFIEDSNRKGMAVEEIVSGLSQWPSLPSLAVPVKPHPPQSTSSSAVDNILKMVAVPQDSAAPSGEADSLAGQLDSIIEQNLRHIFSHDQFRSAEATWRGLQFLVKQAPAEAPFRLQIVPVTPDTLEETLDELLPTLVSNLPSLIMVDLGFDISARSLDLLENIASFSETLLVPCITWIKPGFFFADTWQELNKLPYLPNYMDDMSFAKWRSLRGKPHARWLSLMCNRFLTRYPYGSDNSPRLTRFEEEAPLWISPVWAAAALMVQSLARYGWSTRFSAGSVVRLEDLVMQADATGKSLCTEMYVDDERVDQLIRCGIMPLAGAYNTDSAFIPRETTAGGAALSYQLLVSCISSFILWCKDHFNRDINAVELEDTLKKAFSLFWQQSSQAEPEELEISATTIGGDERVILSLSIKPSRRVLPSAERVDIKFYW